MTSDERDGYPAAANAGRWDDEDEANTTADETDRGAPGRVESNELDAVGDDAGVLAPAEAERATAPVPPRTPPVGAATAAPGAGTGTGHQGQGGTAATPTGREREETFIVSVTMKVRYDASGAAHLPAALLMAGAPRREGTVSSKQTPAVAHKVPLAEPAAVATALLSLPQEYAERDAARTAQEKAAALARKAADAAHKAQARKEADEARRRTALIARAREAGMEVAAATAAAPPPTRPASVAPPAAQPPVPPAHPAIAATPVSAVEPAAAAPPQEIPAPPRVSAPAPPTAPLRPAPAMPAAAVLPPATPALAQADGEAPVQRSIFQ